MGFGWAIVSEFSFTQHTVQVINPLVFSKLGNSLSICSLGQFQACRPTDWCNISSGESLGGLVLSCEEWEADSRRLSRLLLQASVFEWKIIHLEGHCLCKEGGQRSDWEISYTLKCLQQRCNLSVRGKAGDSGSLVSVSICHSHPHAASREPLSSRKQHTSLPRESRWLASAFS